ncbi:peptidase M20 domain-containing protein 2-like [Pygocentrus nattereri]|uniref:Peptidase M20 domain-containing protein 2 n=1 Tax=Pygocentrus nattereri TaxID=42514 RepID=A0A3B4BVC4_PYGNA|nr:peptidase M20 domain-containing protein 2-like [Pygocentrus nattereri]
MASVRGADGERLKHNICVCIEECREKLYGLSQDIWSTPELAFKEKQSHDLLVRFFSEAGGWTVEPSYILETAFRATWCLGTQKNLKVVNVGFLCEYDALPSLGHACGHNLIAEVGVAAAFGLKGALESQADVPVKITVLGTPAEEEGGGKIKLIQAGAFADMDVVFMAHPSQENKAFHPCICIRDCTVKYYGKASHAAAYPWEGVNALDAAVLAYSSLSVLRQQLRPDWRLHGIIKHGGTKPNIIPDYTELEYYMRTPLLKDLSYLKDKVETCFRSAAIATGCQVEITFPNPVYSNILPNPSLEKHYEENGRALGMEFKEECRSFTGSTDFGNVSFVVPGIHPFFYIGTEALNHTPEYATAAGSEKAQMYTLQTAKALAMTAADVLLNPTLLKQVKEEFTVAKCSQEQKSK